MILIKLKRILNKMFKIKKYCEGDWYPNKTQEILFLKDAGISNFMKMTKPNYSNINTGRLSEWYIEELLKKNNYNYITQPKIKYGENGLYLKPDFYLPEKDLFIEVKSRSYNCGGTASEKLDHIPRKYSKLALTNNYKLSKVLIVCCAFELFEKSTLELLNHNCITTREYVKDFVELSKKYNVLDWIPVKKLTEVLNLI